MTKPTRLLFLLKLVYPFRHDKSEILPVGDLYEGE